LPVSRTASFRIYAQRVIGLPEISTDGFKPYTSATRDAFGGRALNVNEASRRYSPAAVIAVAREVVSDVPTDISTSYIERSNLSMRTGSRRFTRLTNAFSKKLVDRGQWRTLGPTLLQP